VEGVDVEEVSTSPFELSGFDMIPSDDEIAVYMDKNPNFDEGK